MPVSLKIISFKEQSYEHNDSFIFNKEGGSIGRSQTCDLVLADQEKLISRHHAEIIYENDTYLLKDTSLSGTFIDDSPTPLNKATVLLADGMILGIGEYQIQVEVLPESDAILLDYAQDRMDSSPFVETAPLQADRDNDLLNQFGTSEPEEDHHLMVDDQALVGESPNPFLADLQDNFIPPSEGNAKLSSLHDSFIPPSPTGERHANDEIPEDFNFEELFEQPSVAPEISGGTSAGEPLQSAGLQQGNEVVASEELSFFSESLSTAAPKPVSVQPEALEQSSLKSSENLYAAFLQGAELNQNELLSSDQVDRMRRIGAMFRQFVDSTMAVLRSRAEFKSLFRVTVTTIKRMDNNPLKFSVNTEEALQHLLNDGQGGFKPSVEAIEEAFQDVLNHQLAMQAGIQASLQEILNQFAPDCIEKQFKEGLVLNKKAKCWDRYCEIYSQLAEVAVEDFYGDTFADAYEKQMKQIGKQPKK